MIIVSIYILIILLFGLYKRVNCFDTFLEGAKKGIINAYHLFPTIVGIVFAVEVFVGSGIIDLLAFLIRNPVIVPELFVQALLKPLSANSALIMMNNIYNLYGANSLTGELSSLIQGCSDTTIYVITIYFGVLQINKTYYTVYVGLLTDLLTFILAIILGVIFL